MKLDRTLISEIVIGSLVAGIIAMGSAIYIQVDNNKITGISNKDHISTNQTTFEAALAARKAAGDAEIKRSTAIDVQGASDIKGNFDELNKQEDEIHANKTAIAVLYERTGQHADAGDDSHGE